VREGEGRNRVVSPRFRRRSGEIEQTRNYEAVPLFRRRRGGGGDICKAAETAESTKF